MSRNLSIKTKMIVAIISVVSLFGLLATLMVFMLVKNNLISLEQNNLEKASISQAQELSHTFELAGGVAKSVATNQGVIEILSSKESQVKKLSSEVSDNLNTYNIADMFSAIYVMDNEGKVLASTVANFIGKNYSFRDYFQSAIKGKPYVDVSIGVTSGKLGYYFSYPSRDKTGKVVGVVVAKLKELAVVNVFDHLNSKRMKLNTDTNMMLVDSYGVTVYANDGKKKLRSLGLLSEDLTSQLREKKRYAGRDIAVMDYEEIQVNLSQLNDEPRVFMLEDEVDGQDELLVAIKVGKYPFYIVSEIGFDKLLLTARDTALLVAVFVFIAAGLAGLVISMLVGKLLKPLDKLKVAVKQVIHGEKVIKIEVDTEDEVGELAKAFNKMIESIARAKASVERKVEEQTAVLVKQKEEVDKAREIAEKINRAMTGRELKMIELKKEIQALKKKGKNASK